MTYPDDSTNIKVKNLSEESRGLLGELERMSTKAAELISRLYASLRKDGFTPVDARKMIEDRIEVSQRTLRRALPDEAKSQNKVRPQQFADILSANHELRSSDATLVLDKEPDIPQEKPHIIEYNPESALESESEPAAIIAKSKSKTVEIEITFGNVIAITKLGEKYRTKAKYFISYNMDEKKMIGLSAELL